MIPLLKRILQLKEKGRLAHRPTNQVRYGWVIGCLFLLLPMTGPTQLNRPFSLDAAAFALTREKPAPESIDRLHDAEKDDSILVPPHRGAERLRQAINHYRDIAAQGGWPILPEGLTLRQGSRGLSTLLLRLRLQATGDLTSEATQEHALYDDILSGAVRRFQRRHGLVEDGVVGPATRTALQVPIEHRLRQLRRNLDRWGELPRDLGPRYIWVNIPAFTLEVVSQNQTVITMRVVVGKPSWPTPELRGWLSTLVLNPHWYIPPNSRTP